MRKEFITTKIISQKCRYALRAVFELACRSQSDVTKISELADVQDVPPRFLENILVELKQAGFVSSRRGNEGGYILAIPAAELTVGQVIEFVQGSGRGSLMPFTKKTLKNGDYAFSLLWQRLNDAISDIYDNTTFAGLIEEESKATKGYIPNYVI